MDVSFDIDLDDFFKLFDALKEKSSKSMMRQISSEAAKVLRDRTLDNIRREFGDKASHRKSSKKGGQTARNALEDAPVYNINEEGYGQVNILGDDMFRAKWFESGTDERFRKLRKTETDADVRKRIEARVDKSLARRRIGEFHPDYEREYRRKLNSLLKNKSVNRRKRVLMKDPDTGRNLKGASTGRIQAMRFFAEAIAGSQGEMTAAMQRKFEELIDKIINNED